MTSSSKLMLNQLQHKPPQLNNRIFSKWCLRLLNFPPPNVSLLAIPKQPVLNMWQQQQTTLRKSSVRKKRAEEERQNRITKVVHKHQFAKAARMLTEGKTEKKETELD